MHRLYGPGEAKHRAELKRQRAGRHSQGRSGAVGSSGERAAVEDAVQEGGDGAPGQAGDSRRAPAGAAGTSRCTTSCAGARHAIPAIFSLRACAEVGSLVSYGITFVDMLQQVGTYTGKILRGAKPADLPVQLGVKFELVINLKTAKALGLEVPFRLLHVADEVIE